MHNCIHVLLNNISSNYLIHNILGILDLQPNMYTTLCDKTKQNKRTKRTIAFGTHDSYKIQVSNSKSINSKSNTWIHVEDLQRLLTSHSCWAMTSIFGNCICSLVSSSILLMFSSSLFSLWPRLSFTAQ